LSALNILPTLYNGYQQSCDFSCPSAESAWKLGDRKPMLKTTAFAPWGTSAKPTLHSEVAQVIAREIGIAVSPEEKVRLGIVRRVNPEAYDDYLKGRDQSGHWSGGGLKKGIAFWMAAWLRPTGKVLRWGSFANRGPSAATPRNPGSTTKNISLQSDVAATGVLTHFFQQARADSSPCSRKVKLVDFTVRSLEDRHRELGPRPGDDDRGSACGTGSRSDAFGEDQGIPQRRFAREPDEMAAQMAACVYCPPFSLTPGTSPSQFDM